MPKFPTVDAYVASLPEPARSHLAAVRPVVVAQVPDGEEAIRYDIPTIVVDGRSVVHYAAWKAHLSLYPAPAAGTALDDELAPYRQAKGTLRFPYAGGLPLDLIGRTVAQLVTQRVTR